MIQFLKSIYRYLFEPHLVKNDDTKKEPLVNIFNKFRIETIIKKYELGKVIVTVNLNNGDKFIIPHEGNIYPYKLPCNLITGQTRYDYSYRDNQIYTGVLNSWTTNKVDNENILNNYYRNSHYVFKKSFLCSQSHLKSFLNEHALVKESDIKSITAQWFSKIEEVEEDTLVEIK